MNLQILYLYVPINPWIDCPTYLKAACMQLHAVSDALLFGVLLFSVENWFGIENGSFICNWISINLFICLGHQLIGSY